MAIEKQISESWLKAAEQFVEDKKTIPFLHASCNACMKAQMWNGMILATAYNVAKTYVQKFAGYNNIETQDAEELIEKILLAGTNSFTSFEAQLGITASKFVGEALKAKLFASHSDAIGHLQRIRQTIQVRRQQLGLS